VFHSEYGSCWSNCNGSVLSQLHFKPDSSVVCNDNGGSSEGGIIGGHWGLYGPCDILSPNVVLRFTGEFGGDTVFFLEVEGEGTSESG
jgi:hypothetical protein